MIGEVALAIEMGADATDIGRTIHPHPTLGETIGLAAEAAPRPLHRPAARGAATARRRISTVRTFLARSR